MLVFSQSNLKYFQFYTNDISFRIKTYNYFTKKKIAMSHFIFSFRQNKIAFHQQYLLVSKVFFDFFNLPRKRNRML
jgi:hypothetical protein